MGKQSIGPEEGGRRSGGRKKKDPAEIGKIDGVVPSLGGRGQHGRTEG